MDPSGAMRLTISRTWYSLSLFSAIVGAVVLTRPPSVFRPDGTLMEFGPGADQSVFSFGVVTSCAAVLSAFVFAMRDMLRAGG